MPCAVVCIPEGHQEKCSAQLSLLQKKNPGLKWAVTDKPIDAVSKANEMGAKEPNKQCSLFVVHSKFFNITKDPFAATMFKAAQKGPVATFGCGKESGCDKPGKKFHWYMGPDGEWDIAAATKNITKLLDGQFTESGFNGKPLRAKQAGAPGAGEISAMGGMQLSPTMSMGNGMGMGMMGPMGMGGGMGGTMGGMGGTMSGSMSSGNLTGSSFGAGGGMNGAMSGQMGSTGLASAGGMGVAGGAQGAMAGGGMMQATDNASMGMMSGTGMGGGGMGISGGTMGMTGGGMSGNAMGMPGGGMSGGGMSGGAMAGGGMGMPGGGMGMGGGSMGMSGGGMGMSGGGMGLGAGAPAASVDVVSEAESMLSKGLPVTDVVKMLAAEVKRLTAVVEGK